MKIKSKLLVVLMLFPLMGASLLPLDVKLNGKLTDTPLLESEEEIFLPIKAFSQLTSMQFTERSDGNVVIFRDNIFIKFNLNTNIYYLNGKELKWKTPPFKEKGELYVPYRILLDYMNFHYSFSEEEVSIVGGGQDVSLSYLQNRQKVDFADAKISYILPFFWERTSPNSFSQEDSNTLIEVITGPLEAREPREILKEEIERLGLKDFQKTDEKLLQIDGRRVLHQGLTKKDEEDKTTDYYGLSIFTLENRYIRTLFYTKNQSIGPLVKLEEEILRSLQLNAYTIDEREEHYVELGGFFAMGMELDSPLYSSMVVDSFLNFRGSIHPSVTSLKATVNRGQRRFEYSFPVEEGSFNAKIPIPFGLGFHSLTLSMPQKEAQDYDELLSFYEDEDALLKLSLLNSSLEEGLFLTYSDQVLSQDPLIGELASQVKSSLYDYEKALELLKVLGESFTPGLTQGPREALETRKLDRKTSALIYAALLRRSGIPTRVISNKSQTLFGVEILSNGLWHTIDPYGYLRGEKDPKFFMSLPKDYFGREGMLHDI